MVPQRPRARQQADASSPKPRSNSICAEARAEGMSAGQVRAQEAIALAAKDAGERRRRATLAPQSNANIASAARGSCAHRARRRHASLRPRRSPPCPPAKWKRRLREAMHQAIGEPRIVLRAVAAGGRTRWRHAPARSRTRKASTAASQVSADPAHQPADCRIEWRGGGAERSVGRHRKRARTN